LIKNDQVLSVLLEHVIENSNNLTLEIHSVAVSVVEVHCFWEMNCVVENRLCSLSNTFLSGSNFVVKISWNWRLANF
jgi:hypothetical protein